MIETEGRTTLGLFHFEVSMRSRDLVLVLLASSLALSGCNLLKKKKRPTTTSEDQAGDLRRCPPTFTAAPPPRIENFAGVYVSNFGTRWCSPSSAGASSRT